VKKAARGGGVGYRRKRKACGEALSKPSHKKEGLWGALGGEGQRKRDQLGRKIEKTTETLSKLEVRHGAGRF